MQQPPGYEHYGRPPSQPDPFRPTERMDPAPSISDAEFEEILSRNKTVSSSAISRAVQDASAGKSLWFTA